MFKPNPSVAQGGNPKLYKGTARVRFGHSKKEIHSEKPQGFSSLKDIYASLLDSKYLYFLSFLRSALFLHLSDKLQFEKRKNVESQNSTFFYILYSFHIQSDFISNKSNKFTIGWLTLASKYCITKKFIKYFRISSVPRNFYCMADCSFNS